MRNVKQRLLRLMLCALLALTAGTASFLSPAEALRAEAATDFTIIFDAAFYLAKYPELAATCGNDAQKLYLHYRNIGIAEGRQPSARFDPVCYISNYPDLVAIFGNSWGSYAKHYVDNGIAEGRIADRLLPGVSQADLSVIAQMTPQMELNYHNEPVTPLADHYHTYTDAAGYQSAYAQATAASGRSLVYNPALVYPGSAVQSYIDGSTQAVCWKEAINGYLCCFAEVTVADGSQFRRKLSGDGFYAGRNVYASVLSTQAGAVVAANADYYMGRGIGTVVYEGLVRRFSSALDTCYVTYDGDILFTYAGQLGSIEEAQAFVTENNVNFAITFGPIIVDNGQQRQVSAYMLGEINDRYCRAALGQIDERHYLIMVMNQDYGFGVSNLHAVAPIMLAKGCQKAYTLDGGLTGAIYINNTRFNRVSVRETSDIIYFATYGG